MEVGADSQPTQLDSQLVILKSSIVPPVLVTKSPSNLEWLSQSQYDRWTKARPRQGQQGQQFNSIKGTTEGSAVFTIHNSGGMSEVPRLVLRDLTARQEATTPTLIMTASTMRQEIKTQTN